MLNDYEIIRNEKDPIQPIISILKLIASSLAVYCFLLMVPDMVEKFYEARENMLDDSLKIRVIANSNTKADQQLKNEMVANLQPIFAEILHNEYNNVDNDEAFAKLATYVQQNYSQYDVKINIGEHLTPPKIEGNTFYPQAYYDTLVLTIGAGRGDNFWCSIFSNLCERPSEKEEVKQEEEQKEVRFIVWEWLKKLFA
ncbi:MULTISPECIES: stage II sporulation protein R [Ureibacillus]|jgi:stage II sporulation protein R|uniref:Stage II sporulation protein R n=1 Tax=Ureibacillus thermosphaericus TaxID=51173 RepID=A0A840PNJ7_URETH|nr:stage II sporulation protein R [Ureibacillus thermosphaericus]MBB5149995.1 stage II sporulation protein R [Ureibacillus thermosphaericus]NKZ32674.1 stage II sporulation protein R [Ureibacillus thermosphaericus]